MSATKLKPDYISKLCGELYDTVSSGMAINDGIYMLMNEGANDFVLEKLLEETSKGCTFTDAIKSTKAFPSYFEDMIEIGETTGRLDSVLNELSLYYARQNEISENIKNAVTFPLILLVILVAIVILLLTQVLPIFNDVFKQLGVTMSAPAMSLMNLGTAIRTYSAAIIGVFVALAAAFIILYNLPSTPNKILSLFKGRKLKTEMSSSKFASAMAMTISSGMDIDESLEMAKKLCDKEIEGKITSCQKMMREGEGFDKAVQKSKILDAVSSRRLTISFNTGKTDEAMKKIADEYSNKINNSIDSKISRVEPVLVIIMSILVGFVLFSVMLPMLSIISSI